MRLTDLDELDGVLLQAAMMSACEGLPRRSRGEATLERTVRADSAEHCLHTALLEKLELLTKEHPGQLKGCLVTVFALAFVSGANYAEARMAMSEAAMTGRPGEI